jgi:hypothetical protein
VGLSDDRSAIFQMRSIQSYHIIEGPPQTYQYDCRQRYYNGLNRQTKTHVLSAITNAEYQKPIEARWYQKNHSTAQVV